MKYRNSLFEKFFEKDSFLKQVIQKMENDSLK
jgi:hypothetical protein